VLTLLFASNYGYLNFLKFPLSFEPTVFSFCSFDFPSPPRPSFLQNLRMWPTLAFSGSFKVFSPLLFNVLVILIYSLPALARYASSFFFPDPLCSTCPILRCLGKCRLSEVLVTEFSPLSQSAAPFYKFFRAQPERSCPHFSLAQLFSTLDLAFLYLS